MHLCLFIYFFFIYIYYTRLYYIIQETRRRIHRYIYDIFSALLWPVSNHIPKVLYICLYVRVRERVPCTEIPPLSIFLYLTHHSITSLPSRLLSLFSLNHRRTDRSYDRLHLRITYLFLSHVSVRVELAWMCDSMFEPRAFSIKEGIIIDS